MIRSIFQCRTYLIRKCICYQHIKIHVRSMSSRDLSEYFDTNLPHLNHDINFNLESNRFRNTLYPDTKDAILTELKSCNSIQQVFDIFLSNKNTFNSEHLCQSVLILRDIQKVFNKFYLNDITHPTTQQRYETEIHESNHAIFQEFQNELLNHEQFKELLSSINHQCIQFNIDETVCTILYLRFLGLDINHDTVQRLIDHAGKLFKQIPQEEYDNLSCQTLSRFFSSFKHNESLYCLLTLSRLLPIVIEKLDKCVDIYELGQIAVCLEVVKDLMNRDLRDQFRNKLETIIDPLKITQIEETRSLLKILLFLNDNCWCEENTELIKRLLLLMGNHIELLDIKEIIYLQRIFSSMLEPYYFLDRVQKRLESVISRCEDMRGEPSLGTLACMAPVANQKQKKYIEKTLLKKLKEPGNLLNTMTTLSTVTELMRFLNTESNEIHVLYWDRVLVLLQDQPNLAFLMYFTIRYIKRYLFQNNFRNPNFEEFVTKTLWTEIDYAPPNFLAQYASVLLKFSPSYARTMIPSHLMNKLTDNVDQFGLLTCFVLMDALVFVLKSFPPHAKQLSPRFSVQVTQLERRLEARINEILDEPEPISMVDCFEIFHKLKCKNWQHIYEKLYNKIPAESINSKVIYAACRYAIYSVPNVDLHQLLNKMVTYCEANGDHIIGLVVSYLLYTCYFCSYPLNTKHPAFLDNASDILLRDKAALNGLLMIRATLALAYFQSLAPPLANYIFSLNFLEYLDDEMCNQMPQNITLRVRNDLMELNRAVCLDYAQFGIPWFHQKYVQQLERTKTPSIAYSKFHKDVYGVLSHYVGDESLVHTDVTSPYGQKIDFVLYLDKLGKPIRTLDSAPLRNVQTRLAILLEQKWSRGPCDLNRRHLELQGYSVINLYRKQWNALFMGEPKDKHVFLDQIFSQYRPLITPGDLL